MSRTVGVVGGGQLARMMHQAAISLGIDVVVLDPDPDCSAARAGARRFDGTWTSAEDLLAFARSGVDVVTFDHELADPDDLRALVGAADVPVHPTPDAMLHAQDKLVARERLGAAGLAVPAWSAVADAAAVAAFAQAGGGWPVVLKSARGGYDGRGVWVVGDEREAAGVLAHDTPAGFLVEELVDIAQEVAVMVARRPSGEIRSWPLLQTTQVDGICTEVALERDAVLDARARELAVGIAEQIDLTGVMAVELFVTPSGELLVNELACRPHNSGHVTQDACRTDQFEQHLRAVLDLPLGDPGLVVDAAVMVNLIGGEEAWTDADLATALAVEAVALHVYGKGHRRGRKLGHVNAVGATVGEAADRGRRAAAALVG